MSELEQLAIAYVKAREAYSKARSEYNDLYRGLWATPYEQRDLSMVDKLEKARRSTKAASLKAEAALRAYVLERGEGEL